MESDLRQRKRIRLARRVYTLRVLGLGLGFFCVSSVLYQKETNPLVWFGVALNGLVWPHIAYYLSKKSSEPYRAELRNFLLDSFFGSIWIPFMGFNVFPSVTLFVMLSMNNISTGGMRLFLKGVLALFAGMVVGIALGGFHFQPESTVGQMLLSVPLLTVYPLSLGMVIYTLTLKLRARNKSLQLLSQTDGLTGISNRRHWEENVASEFRRCKRTGEISTLIMLDIDSFKNVNDSYGHLAGDEVLIKIAQILQKNIRTTDSLGRYGGEEFGVILPNSDAKGAFVIAEKLRDCVCQNVLLDSHNIRCTISLGVAQLCDSHSEYSRWIDDSDKALYKAKEMGRNRTVVY